MSEINSLFSFFYLSSQSTPDSSASAAAALAAAAAAAALGRVLAPLGALPPRAGVGSRLIRHGARPLTRALQLVAAAAAAHALQWSWAMMVVSLRLGAPANRNVPVWPNGLADEHGTLISAWREALSKRKSMCRLRSRAGIASQLVRAPRDIAP